MDVLEKALNGVAGYYNIAFILLFLVLSIFFFLSLLKKKYDNAFIYFLFVIPIAIKTPNFYTIYERNSFYIPVNEGLTFYSIYLILFLLSIRKDYFFLVIFNTLRKKKLILIGFITVLSFGITQQLALPVDFGFLLAYNKIIDPFFFTVIASYIFFKYNQKLETLTIWIVFSILYSILFSIISGLAINYDYLGVLRFGGGSIGSSTIAGAIFVTWAIICLGTFFTSKNENLKSLFAILFGILSFCALMAHTRGPLGYFAIGIFLLLGNLLKYIKNKIIGIMILLMPILILILFKPVSNEIFKRNFDLNKINEDGSFNERIKRNAEAFKLISESPLKGIGFANPKSGERGKEEFEVYFHVYNTPLAWATYGGIFSGIGFVLINIIIFKFSFKKSRYLHQNNNVSKIFRITLICWFIDYFTTGNDLLFGYPFTAVVYFYLILGIIIGNFVYISKYERSVM